MVGGSGVMRWEWSGGWKWGDGVGMGGVGGSG